MGKRVEKKTLNQKQIAFCRLKAEGKSDFQAAKEAGYTEEYVQKLVRQEYIQKEIAAMQKQQKKEGIADDAEILKFLTRVMTGEAYEKKTDAVMKDRMRAAELLGKGRNLFETAMEEEGITIVDDIIGKQG